MAYSFPKNFFQHNSANPTHSAQSNQAHHRSSKSLLRWLKRCRWMSGLLAAGLIGGTAVPVEAAARQQESLSVAQSMPQSQPVLALEFNLGDLIQNTIRYIQVSNISNEEEVAIGEQINDMLLQRQYDLYQNSAVNQYVDQVGQRLVEASDRRDIPYTFQIVRSEEINAFAIPGGYIYVTTGLLQAVDNEAQLASVVAHEIAHVNERHSVQALKRQVLARGIAETAGLDTSTLAQIGYQVAVDLPRTRDFEYEADEVGIEILDNAGYAPIAAINFFENLQNRGATPEFLRTHPTNENRIEALRSQIDSGDAYAGRGLSESQYNRQISPLL
jgi:predicted Zn-dependent protease